VANFPEPLARCRFFLELKLDGSDESVDGYFMECSGFKVTQDIIEATEVTPQKWGKSKKGLVVTTKIPGNVKYNNLVLRRGLTCSMTLWNWLDSIQEGKWGEKRKDGSLTIYDQGAQQQFRLEFKNAWPVSYTISDLSVSSGELEIEEMEVAVEELKRVAV
jgi:phage tail-like protein